MLFRASHHSGPLEVELTRRNIPFVKFGGLKFLDAAHVKDVLARAALRREPARPRRRLPRAAAAARHRPVDRRPASSTRWPTSPDPAIGARRLRSRRRAPRRTGRASSTLFAGLRAARRPGRPSSSGSRLWYEPHLERIHEDAAMRRADLLQLEQIAAGYPSRERFLTELTLDPPDATSDQAGPPHLDEDYLILSTIHSAKGQEWKTVFVLNAVDGCIPSDLGAGTSDEIEEERRLLYVAMTRAKDALHLVMPQRFYVHGQARARRPPRLRLAHPLHSRQDPRPTSSACAWPPAGRRRRAGRRSPPCAST